MGEIDISYLNTHSIRLNSTLFSRFSGCVTVVTGNDKRHVIQNLERNEAKKLVAFVKDCLKSLEQDSGKRATARGDYWRCPHCGAVLGKSFKGEEGRFFGKLAIVGSVTCASCGGSVDHAEVYRGIYDA